MALYLYCLFENRLSLTKEIIKTEFPFFPFLEKLASTILFFFYQFSTHFSDLRPTFTTTTQRMRIPHLVFRLKGEHKTVDSHRFPDIYPSHLNNRAAKLVPTPFLYQKAKQITLNLSVKFGVYIICEYNFNSSYSKSGFS